MSIEQARIKWSLPWPLASVTIAVFLMLTLVLYQQTVLYLVEKWNQLAIGEYAHGYLVLAISLYLILRKRRKLAMLTPSLNYRALPVVVVVGLLWLVAVLVQVSIVQAVALLLLILSVTWMLLGNQVTKELLFPILFIIFAIPVWFPLSPLLQELTANVVFWIIRLIEVPAFRQETMIQVPSGMLSVTEACAGLRYLLAAMILGTLYAWLNYEGLRARIIVVLICAFTAVLANIVRVLIVVYLAYVSEMQHPLVDDHLMLGWYIFGGMVVVLLLVDMRLYRYHRLDDADRKAAQNSRDENHLAPYESKTSILNYIIIVVAGLVAVSLGPATVYSFTNHPDLYIPDNKLKLPEKEGGWASVSGLSDDWQPVYHGAQNQKAVYKKGEAKVILYIGYYTDQYQGEELINSLNRISNEDVWKIAYSSAHLMDNADYQVLEQFLEKSGGEKRLVWYWYVVADHTTTNRYEAKLLQVLGLLTGKHHAYVVAVSTDVGDSKEGAREKLLDFIVQVMPSMEKQKVITRSELLPNGIGDSVRY